LIFCELINLKNCHRSLVFSNEIVPLNYIPKWKFSRFMNLWNQPVCWTYKCVAKQWDQQWAHSGTARGQELWCWRSPRRYLPASGFRWYMPDILVHQKRAIIHIFWMEDNLNLWKFIYFVRKNDLVRSLYLGIQRTLLGVLDMQIWLIIFF
jgi:hypothetical protein